MDFAFDVTEEYDYSSNLPDECLEIIFQSLSSADRLRCALVCRRWLIVEGRSHSRIAFKAAAGIIPYIPSIFTRFDSVTKLALQCNRKRSSINDDALALISLRCLNLTRLKLRGCGDVSDDGMAAMAKNCKSLKKFSCGYCKFGAKGMNALLNHCSLEQLTVKRLKGLNDADITETIGPGLASSSLKSICLQDVNNAQSFAPLLIESKNLKTLKLLNCSGEWDGLLTTICTGNQSLNDIRLEKLHVTDVGLEGVSECSNLEVLHLLKLIQCTDDGLREIAANCRQLTKLHIDGWRTNRIGDQGIIAVAKNVINLQELVLIGINPSIVSIGWISSYCTKLERLAICSSDTIGDREISCIASKTLALQKLCIKGCQLVTDDGVIAFAYGCPNLVKLKVKKCKKVTSGVVEYVQARRPGLEINLDVKKVVVEAEPVDPRDIYEGIQMSSLEVTERTQVNRSDDATAESSNNAARLSEYFKSRGIGFFNGMAYSIRRWSNGNDNYGNSLGN